MVNSSNLNKRSLEVKKFIHNIFCDRGMRRETKREEVKTKGIQLLMRKRLSFSLSRCRVIFLSTCIYAIVESFSIFYNLFFVFQFLIIYFMLTNPFSLLALLYSFF